MIKAATIPLGLTLLLALSPGGNAQAPGQETAVNEAIYRQANTITLRQKLADARSAQDRRDLVTAAKLYSDCWDLIQKIGSGVDPEAQETRIGVAAVRLELAQAAQHRGDLPGANRHVEEVLRVDPGNPAAIQFKRENDK